MFQSCSSCLQAIKTDSSPKSSLTKLVDLKSRGGLIHANLRFFYFIRHVEACFAKNANHIDVFDLTIDEVLATYNFTFPCEEHASDVLSYSIIYYIRLRMRQYAHQQNLKLKPKFVIKKKLSKLTNE